MNRPYLRPVSSFVGASVSAKPNGLMGPWGVPPTGVRMKTRAAGQAYTPQEAAALHAWAQKQGLIPADPVQMTPPQPGIALGRMRLSCSQWSGLAPALKTSLVRGVLEGMGFPSLNTANRGNIVYTLVDQINAFCARQASVASAMSMYRGGRP